MPEERFLALLEYLGMGHNEFGLIRATLLEPGLMDSTHYLFKVVPLSERNQVVQAHHDASHGLLICDDTKCTLNSICGM